MMSLFTDGPGTTPATRVVLLNPVLPEGGLKRRVEVDLPLDTTVNASALVTKDRSTDSPGLDSRSPRSNTGTRRSREDG